MAYVKSIYDFGGNKYDIKDGAAIKDVQLAGSDLSFYDGDNTLIKTISLPAGAQKWTAQFTQQYVDSIKRSMALTPVDFTIDDVKVGDIVVASGSTQYTDVPTGWLINWNSGDSSNVGILVIDNITDLNLYYPLGYTYMFIVNYVDKTNNFVYLHMIPPHYRDHYIDVLPNNSTNKATSLAAMARLRPYYLVDNDSLSVINWPNTTSGNFTSFKYNTDSATMLFDDGRYVQWLTITDETSENNFEYVYTPKLGNSVMSGIPLLGKPEVIFKKKSFKSLYPVQTVARVEGPIDGVAQVWYDRLITFNHQTFAIVKTVLLFGQWH